MDFDEVIADLMRESGDRLLRLAFQLCHERATAEDLVQEALTRVYASWRRRAPEVQFGEAYVRRAIVNEYLRRRRLRSSTEVVTDEVPDEPDRRLDHGFDHDVVERDRLWRALETLSARQRVVLVLRYFEDATDSDIAELLHAREATVRSLAARGLAALRTHELVTEGG
jgi:RNA polymerase sigma factor (sigma-70 family)